MGAFQETAGEAIRINKPLSRILATFLLRERTLFPHIPSSGIFRVVDSRRCSEPIKSRLRSSSTRNISVLQIGGCSGSVLPFGQNQEPSLFTRCARLNGNDTLVAFPAVALIFRGHSNKSKHRATSPPRLGIFRNSEFSRYSVNGISVRCG
jgi:hypothetical protein